MIDRKADPIRFAREVVGGDPFATFLGIVVEEVRDSYARLRLKVREEVCNADGRRARWSRLGACGRNLCRGRKFQRVPCIQFGNEDQLFSGH